jgi:hypothetical protein
MCQHVVYRALSRTHMGGGIDIQTRAYIYMHLHTCRLSACAHSHTHLVGRVVVLAGISVIQGANTRTVQNIGVQLLALDHP